MKPDKHLVIAVLPISAAVGVALWHGLGCCRLGYCRLTGNLVQYPAILHVASKAVRMKQAHHN